MEGLVDPESVENLKELEELRHENKMEELVYHRKTLEAEHNRILERERIKRAEDKKAAIANAERQKDLILFRTDHWVEKKRK